MNIRGRQKGFTLLELLISITMIGLIVLIVSGAMRLSYRSVSSGEKRIDQLERLRMTVGILAAQVQSSLPLKLDKDTEPKNSLSGQDDELDLATNYSLWKGQAGYVLATYSIAPGPDGKQTLSIAEHTVGLGDTHQAELLTGCEEMHFSYYAKDTTESEGSWKDAWTDENLIPEKIRLTMKKSGRDMSITIPLRVRGPEDWITFQVTDQQEEQD
jgi:general secretion pathway protein J